MSLASEWAARNAAADREYREAAAARPTRESWGMKLRVDDAGNLSAVIDRSFEPSDALALADWIYATFGEGQRAAATPEGSAR